jgi:hypothetical protein
LRESQIDWRSLQSLGFVPPSRTPVLVLKLKRSGFTRRHRQALMARSRIEGAQCGKGQIPEHNRLDPGWLGD